MRRPQRLIAIATVIALSGALAGCGGGGMSSFDPSDLLDFLDTKKKLPGERKPVFPEGVFVLASTLRIVTVAVLCGLIVRDILRPERDPVRQTYEDDPDGGVFDGAADAPWLVRWRERRARAGGAPPADNPDREPVTV